MLDEDLLRFYVDQWNRYLYSIKILSFLFFNPHQHWVQLARQRGFTSIYEIFPVS